MKRGKEEGAGSTGFPACVQDGEFHIRRRNLPHWQFPGSTYFLTFRLRKGILTEKEQLVVLDTIKHFHTIRYWITAAVIMPNHVHLLLKPLRVGSQEQPISKILQGIKGFSARVINKNRSTKGSLWQDESFDRIVRDYDEYLEKWDYIRNNPVKSELCQAPEDYPYLWEPREYQG